MNLEIKLRRVNILTGTIMEVFGPSTARHFRLCDEMNEPNETNNHPFREYSPCVEM